MSADEQQQQQPHEEHILYDMRAHYSPSKGLNESDMDANPFTQFKKWLFEAAQSDPVGEANAMTLCTATPDGMPSGRMVLLKAFSEKGGFVFFTNYRSVKSAQLVVNPRAALVFYWGNLNRSVRIEGNVLKASDSEAEEYFQSRPRGSQLGAWVSSQQSAVIEGGRDELDRRLDQLNSVYNSPETPIPKPDFWGGWTVLPNSIEFWQGRPDRLHDRLRYERQPGDLSWKLCRLWP